MIEIDRVNSINTINNIFNAKSIAIIGASKDLTKVGGRPIHFLLKQGYKGEVYPINPKYDKIGGLKAYGSILDVPSSVEVAILALSGARIIKGIEECAKKGVKTAVIFAGGFAEAGEEGNRIQNELLNIAKQSKMHIVGPNCLGVANLTNGTILSFAEVFGSSIKVTGSIGFVSQSGGIGFNILDHAQYEKVGFNYWATTGNEADLGFLDFLEYMVELPEVKAVGGYIESLKDGKRFRAIANRARNLEKPIVMLKVGTTETGQKAVTSHTGALAGEDSLYSTAFKQDGVIRVKDRTELLDTLKLSVSNKKPKGNRIGILTGSGGNGIMMADAATEYGLEVVPTSDEIKEKLKNKLPSFGSAQNPIDVTAQVMNDPRIFKECFELLLQEERFDSIVVVLGGLEGFIEDLKDVILQSDKFVCFVSPVKSQAAFDVATSYNIPYYEDITRCVKALSKVTEIGLNFQSRIKIDEDNLEDLTQIDSRLSNFNGAVSEWDTKQLLTKFITTPNGGISYNEGEVVNVARKIGYPVVMKTNSNKISHKSDVGAVKINIKNDEEAKVAFTEIKNSVQRYLNSVDFEGVLIESFVSKEGIEVVVGFNKDPVFGHSITFGLGGIFVELLKDVTTRVLPIDKKEIKTLLREVKGWPLLEGYRGDSTYDIDALSDTIFRVSKFVEQNSSEIQELEFNPIKVLPKGEGVIALDALLRVNQE
ncbi:acetate--CoA ligase family protein [Oceanobacillus longus]|uniref:Acetate--CoA ligase family protein n=1 Tax=Oceanobacillus longus TaxID=930120 RepID=A0ABV8GY36_9BACI